MSAGGRTPEDLAGGPDPATDRPAGSEPARRRPVPTPGAPATRVAGLALEHPVLNAAGTARTTDEVARLADGPLAAITVGSYTLQPRAGNAGEVFVAGEIEALNALGLPNRGATAMVEAVAAMRDLLPGADADPGAGDVARRPLIVSVAGFSSAEYGELAGRAAAAGADLVELNLGCPNVWHDGAQHRIASFDPALVAAAVTAARAATGPVPVAAKLSPLGDPVLLAEVADALAGAGARACVACNTFPNGLSLSADGRPALGPRYGGVSGPALRAIARGQVAQLRDRLPASVDVVGVGGVRTGADVRDLLRAGAAAVGAATAFWASGESPAAFVDLLADWASTDDG